MTKSPKPAASKKADDDAPKKSDGEKWLVRAGASPTGAIMNVCETQAEAEAEIVTHRQLGRGLNTAWLQPFDDSMVATETHEADEEAAKKNPAGSATPSAQPAPSTLAVAKALDKPETPETDPALAKDLAAGPGADSQAGGQSGSVS